MKIFPTKELDVFSFNWNNKNKTKPQKKKRKKEHAPKNPNQPTFLKITFHCRKKGKVMLAHLSYTLKSQFSFKSFPWCTPSHCPYSLTILLVPDRSLLFNPPKLGRGSPHLPWLCLRVPARAGPGDSRAWHSTQRCVMLLGLQAGLASPTHSSGLLQRCWELLCSWECLVQGWAVLCSPKPTVGGMAQPHLQVTSAGSVCWQCW